MRCSAAGSKRAPARSSSAPPAPASRPWPPSSPSPPPSTGSRSALFIFDESPATLLTRCDALNVDLQRQVDAGLVSLQQVDPAELTPGEFVHAIRTAVEDRDAKIVVIDSLNGYLNAMPEERHLIIQLHELLMYLSQKGVATILVGAHQGLIGAQMTTPVDATYLADAVILLRYFESRGEVRQAISVMKKRGSKHERTLRDFRLDGGRIVIGEPLREFRGVLTGVPIYEGREIPAAGQRRRVTADQPRDRRLLFLAATSRDAATTDAMLSPLGIGVEICRSFDELIRELTAGAGAILLPEEALSPAHTAALRAVLAAQPPWSDLPVLVLTRPGADSAESNEAVQQLGNVTLLERPVRLATLLTAVRTALRARARQYQIREHLAERARSEESLRLADRRKDEFLATLGHELRNPLAPLLNAVHLLKTVDNQDPVAIRAREVMERQISHLVRLVDDLLEVSRITRGLVEVRREPIDLAFVIHSAIDTSRPAIDMAGHRLTVDLPAEPIAVYGDTVRLTQVFANLLNNAAKYTNGGGHIWIALRKDGQPRHRVGARQRHRHRRRSTRVGVRDVHAGRSVQPPGARRAGHRPDAGPQPGGDARRHRGGAQRRPGQRQRVRRRAPGARPSGADQRRCRAAAGLSPPAHPGRRRQPRRGRYAWRAAERARRHGVGRPQRRRRARRVVVVRARRGAARHRHAGDGRLRGGAPDSRHRRRIGRCCSSP